MGSKTQRPRALGLTRSFGQVYSRELVGEPQMGEERSWPSGGGVVGAEESRKSTNGSLFNSTRTLAAGQHTTP
jgi:hypothetical protein